MKINCRACFNITVFALILLALNTVVAQAPLETNQADNKDAQQKEEQKKEEQKTEEQKKEEQKKKENAAQNQLQLGKAYENEDQFKEAEAAYVKALESENEKTQAEALEKIKAIIQKRESASQKYLQSPFESVSTTAITTVLTAGASFLFLMSLVFLSFLVKSPAEQFGKWRGKARLIIEPFTDTTEHKLGENMVKVFEIFRQLIDKHYQRRNLTVQGVKMPYLLKSQASSLTQLAESFAPQGWGKVISWFTGKLMRPEFAIQGMIQANGTKLDIFVILVRRGEILRAWSREMSTSGTPVLLDAQKDLAYEVLMYLKEYWEDEYAR